MQKAHVPDAIRDPGLHPMTTEQLRAADIAPQMRGDLRRDIGDMVDRGGWIEKREFRLGDVASHIRMRSGHGA